MAALLAAGALALWFSPAGLSAGDKPSEPAKSTDLFPTVIAKGKGFEIKRSQLDEAMVGLKAGMSAQGQPITAEQIAMVEPRILERLIQVQLLVNKANDEEKKAAKETATRRIESIKTRAGSEENLNRQLKAVGTSEAELRSRMTEESTAQAVLERELKVTVSDADAKKFYEDNPAKFEQPETVRASHILFATQDLENGKDLPADKKEAKRKLAEDVLKRARAGEDFAKLAKEYSEDPGSKDNGGEYTFPRGQMAPEFEAAAFSLKTNQVSDIVSTQYGYHIIKLSEKMPAKKVELAKVSDDIKEYLKQQQMEKKQQEAQEYLAQLQKDASVEILVPELKPKPLPQGLAPGAPPSGQAPAKSDTKAKL